MLQKDSFKSWNWEHVFSQKQGYIWRSDTEASTTELLYPIKHLKPCPSLPFHPHNQLILCILALFSVKCNSDHVPPMDSLKEKKKNWSESSPNFSAPCITCNWHTLSSPSLAGYVSWEPSQTPQGCPSQSGHTSPGWLLSVSLSSLPHSQEPSPLEQVAGWQPLAYTFYLSMLALCAGLSRSVVSDSLQPRGL